MNETEHLRTYAARRHKELANENAMLRRERDEARAQLASQEDQVGDLVRRCGYDVEEAKRQKYNTQTNANEARKECQRLRAQLAEEVNIAARASEDYDSLRAEADQLAEQCRAARLRVVELEGEVVALSAPHPGLDPRCSHPLACYDDDVTRCRWCDAETRVVELEGALKGSIWIAKHNCHLEQTTELVVRLRNDIIKHCYAALGGEGETIAQQAGSTCQEPTVRSVSAGTAEPSRWGEDSVSVCADGGPGTIDELEARVVELEGLVRCAYQEGWLETRDDRTRKEEEADWVRSETSAALDSGGRWVGDREYWENPKPKGQGGQ